MSLHFTLAKKLIAHAKDLIKHIFNEAGQDAKALEKKFLEALKDHAADELEKVEDKVGDTLQHWERAPDAANMTSPYAAPALPEEEDDSEGESDSSEVAPTSAPSATPSDNSAASETAATDATGEKDGDKKEDEKKEDDAPAFAAPSGDQHTYGDADAPAFDPKEATPPDTTALPTEGAASVHGEPWPSSSLQSQAAADAGKDLGAGSELDLGKSDGESEPSENSGSDVEPSKTSLPDSPASNSDSAPTVTDTATLPASATSEADKANEAAAAEQAAAPAIAEGTVKVNGVDSAPGAASVDTDASKTDTATVNENGGGAAAVEQKVDEGKKDN